ncbi:biotin carboxylase [Bartonella silvatica]|uniref:Biotin carboxylase n=1 Tax=Bartonella silvatica TaxID=357760 RepID=A0ABV2HIR0_9HYPH
MSLTKKIISAIHSHHKIDAIITLTEKALPLASELSRFLGLKALSWETMERIQNKYAMRLFLSDHAEYSLKFAKPKNKKELECFFTTTGSPLIVKPIDGYDSKDVIQVNSINDIENICFSSNLIAEEFISGEEYSVEAFSFSGNHKIIAITKKDLIENEDGKNFTEIGHCVPADLSKTVQQKIINYISQFLTLIGLDEGPSHTEIKLDGEKIRIIETHNRIGGDRISSLVKLSTGIDLVQLSILWPLGLCAPIEKNIINFCSAAIRFFTPGPGYGKLERIEGYETLQYFPNIVDIELHCKLGDFIYPISNSSNRYGFVIAIGSNEDDATKTARKAASSLHFIVNCNEKSLPRS